MLAGSTYTTRLWCVLECYTFLRMGGLLERIELLPLRGLGVDEVRKAFRGFDVSEARCSTDEATQQLLGVVESGFGDVNTFNSLVREIFTDMLCEYSQHGEDEEREDRAKGRRKSSAFSHMAPRGKAPAAAHLMAV